MQRSLADWGGNILAFAIAIAVNSMANGIPLGGQTTGEISAKYNTLFTPANFTFSIWGLIYLVPVLLVLYFPVRFFWALLKRLFGPRKPKTAKNVPASEPEETS